MLETKNKINNLSQFGDQLKITDWLILSNHSITLYIESELPHFYICATIHHHGWCSTISISSSVLSSAWLPLFLNRRWMLNPYAGSDMTGWWCGGWPQMTGMITRHHPCIARGCGSSGNLIAVLQYIHWWYHGVVCFFVRFLHPRLDCPLGVTSHTISTSATATARKMEEKCEIISSKVEV